MIEEFKQAFENYAKHHEVSDNLPMMAAIMKALRALPSPEEQIRILKDMLPIRSLATYLASKNIDVNPIFAELNKMASQNNADAKAAAPTPSVPKGGALQGPLSGLPKLRPAPKAVGVTPISNTPESNAASSDSNENGQPQLQPTAAPRGRYSIRRIQGSRPNAGGGSKNQVPDDTAEPNVADDGEKSQAPDAGQQNNPQKAVKQNPFAGIGKKLSDLKDGVMNKFTSGSAAGGSSEATGDKKPSAGKGPKIAFGVLAGLILIVVLGVLWRLGNENGEYNASDNSSAASLGLSACTTADGLPGVTRYNVMPNQDIVGLSGFEDPQRNLPYQNSALVFEQGKSYQAIIVGDNYRVGLGTDISVYAPVYSFTQTGSECVQEVAVEVLTSGIESQQRASVQLAYKIDFSHWSGWLVTLSLLSIVGFTGLTMFMSGGKIKDFLSMIFHVASGAVIVSFASMPPWVFFLFYIRDYHATVNFGNKSELQEQRDSFEAGNQLRLPESMKSLFESLSRGFGIAGGYDWSPSASFSALMLFVGAVAASASSLVRAFDDQMMAIGIGALFVVFSFAMEAWRRGLAGDWAAFGVGFLGLLDFGIYVTAFGTNPPEVLDFSPTALAVVGWAATFIIVALINFGVQAASERTELQRDRMSDGMLFYSAMKLVAVLSYVFYFLM